MSLKGPCSPFKKCGAPSLSPGAKIRGPLNDCFVGCSKAGVRLSAFGGANLVSYDSIIEEQAGARRAGRGFPFSKLRLEAEEQNLKNT